MNRPQLGHYYWEGKEMRGERAKLVARAGKANTIEEYMVYIKQVRAYDLKQDGLRANHAKYWADRRITERKQFLGFLIVIFSLWGIYGLYHAITGLSAIP